MKAAGVVFQSLLDGRVQYQVPLFQRTYSWGEDQWERMWEDILEVYSMEHPRNHFIGAIVTQPLGDPAGETTRFLLIDGQQRFTTLFILLACICHRGHANQHSQEHVNLASEVWDTCLVNKYAQDGDFYKLRPTQRDRGPFEEVLQRSDASGDDRIRQAFLFFDGKIDKGDLDENPIDLPKLKRCITGRLDLVSINLETADSPHRIFESLNNTGMQLGPSDLVRNLLFMNIPIESEAEYAYNHFWFPMQEKTGNKLDDFFWRYLMMDGSLPRQDETFEEIKSRFEKSSITPLTALEEFAKFAQYYRWLTGQEQLVGNPSLTSQIARLNQWEVSVAYPFLMWAFEFWGLGRIDTPALTNVMKGIESFVIRRSVCSVPTNRLRRIFARMHLSVDVGNFVTTSLDYLRGENWPTDQQFREAFVRYPLYYASRLDRTRLILDSLEVSMANKETPAFTGEITVEHIMPQQLTDEWKSHLGHDWQEVHGELLHTPGNLTLTGHNSELGNMAIDQKKEIYRKSIFNMTKGILNYPAWSRGSILARGEALANGAVRIWPR